MIFTWHCTKSIIRYISLLIGTKSSSWSSQKPTNGSIQSAQKHQIRTINVPRTILIGLLDFLSRFQQWSSFITFPHQYPRRVPWFPIRSTCPVNLNILGQSNFNDTRWKEQMARLSLPCISLMPEYCLQRRPMSSRSQFLFLPLRWWPSSHPYKTTGQTWPSLRNPSGKNHGTPQSA